MENVQFDWLTELNHVQFATKQPNQPVQVIAHPPGWMLLGAGNYAAVLANEQFSEYVVKIRVYTATEEMRVRQEFDEEVQVYQRIGTHPAFSELFYAEFPYLVLKKITGKTFLQMIRTGERIHPKHIRAVNEALRYASRKGLHPHDVHIKNIMISNDQVIIADISDFLKSDYCRLWDDCQRFYWTLYFPIIYPFGFKIPETLLENMKNQYRKIVPYGNR